MARKKKLTPAQLKEETKKYEKVMEEYEITNIKPEVIQKSYRLKDGLLEGTNIGVRILEDDLNNPDFLEWIYNQKKITTSIRFVIEEAIRKYGTGDLSEQLYSGMPKEQTYNRKHDPIETANKPLAENVTDTIIATTPTVTNEGMSLQSENVDSKKDISELSEDNGTTPIQTNNLNVTDTVTELPEQDNVSVLKNSEESDNTRELTPEEEELERGW